MISKKQLLAHASVLLEQAGAPQLQAPLLSLLTTQLSESDEEISPESAQAIRVTLQRATDVLAAINGYLTHCIAWGTGLDEICTGGGSTAWLIEDFDVPCLQVLITNEKDQVPKNPETDLMTFGVYRKDQGDAGICVDLQGRAGLNAWYEENVGYRPDDDAGDSLPIESLIKMVASVMLQHRKAK